MANLTVRRNGGQPSSEPAPRDPWTLARRLMSWDPFQEMTLPFSLGDTVSFNPSFDVKETKEAYEYKADVPGVASRDLEVTSTENRLTIRGHRATDTEEKGETWYMCERTSGSFARTFTLPEGIERDGIRADLKDGILVVTVPKKAAVQPKQIPIGGGPAAKH